RRSDRAPSAPPGPARGASAGAAPPCGSPPPARASPAGARRDPRRGRAARARDRPGRASSRGRGTPRRGTRRARPARRRRRPAWTDPLFSCVHLVHRALPELRLADVDLGAELSGGRLAAPFIILGMTGGTPAAAAINRDLARVAEEEGVAFGVGSMRILLDRP